jgi:exodeoxyribonuclease VII large subunit
MHRPVEPAPRREIYTVSRLNREARMLLEAGLPPLWIEGEISNFARPSSGHWYFTLKDADAQVRCAMFRSANLRARVAPRDGMQVLVRARVSLYEARGEYQLIAELLEDAGEGALRRRFEELKAKLAAEGLFDAALKRALPRLPRRIGVVTSPTGAAIRDILHVLARRFPAIPVLIYPVPVQGAGAAAEIAAAIRLASERRDADVLILARGGGSLEDLWAFNEEPVARAIRDSAVPVVSGVGHEIDFTIADFAADVRAPTPSGAAEVVVPDRAEWLRALGASHERLARAWRRVGGQARERLAWLARRLELTHPRTRLTARAQRLDELEARLGRALRRELAAAGARLAAAARTLNAVSPIATLERGYAIVTRADGRVVRAARDVAAGDTVRARTAVGSIAATVTIVEN